MNPRLLRCEGTGPCDNAVPKRRSQVTTSDVLLTEHDGVPHACHSARCLAVPRESDLTRAYGLATAVSSLGRRLMRRFVSIERRDRDISIGEQAKLTRPPPTLERFLSHRL